MLAFIVILFAAALLLAGGWCWYLLRESLRDETDDRV